MGGRAPRGIFFYARCTGGAGRWRGQGLVADQWPQPRHGDGRACIESASERFGRPWRSENRECIECTSESAPRCADLFVSRAREAIRKIASALNLHLKGRRLAQVYASYARARRRRRCSFWRIRLAARCGSGEELRGRADCWPAPRQANGSRTSARSRFRAAALCSYPLARGRAERRAGFSFMRDAPAALAAGGAKGSSPTNGRSRGTVMVARALNSASERFGRPWRSENRECIESTSESAPRCADLFVSRAREAIRKIASALNLHLKGRRLAQVYASYARARRRRRCSFWRIRLAARCGSGEELRGRADCWPAPRQANGSRTSARSRFRAAALVLLSVGPWAAERRAGFSFMRDAPAALAAGGAKGSSPTNGRSRGTVMVARALNLLLKGSAAPGDPKIASALNLHLKVLRVAQICSSHAHARRSEKSPVH